MNYKKIQLLEIKDNFFQRIGTDWMLVSAGTPGDSNAMTASWGQIGILWNKPVATMYIRPQRYTRQFTDRDDRFSLSFFAPGENRKALGIMGSKSGRDCDKIAEAGLSIQGFGENNIAAFDGASLIIICRKIYHQDLTEDSFVDLSIIDEMYPEKDYHRMYVGEIEEVFLKE